MNIDKKKIIVIIIIAIIIIILFKILTQDNTTKNLQSYVKKKGYFNEGTSYIYSKQISKLDLDSYYNSKNDSEYEVNYFDTKSYQFKKNKRVRQDNLESNLNMIYDFKTDTITYNYRVVVNNSSFIFKGEYKYNVKKVDFTCEKEYAYNFKMDNSDKETCDKLKLNNSNFYNEILNTITNIRLLNKLQKGPK